VPEATRAAIARELPFAARPDELVREPDGALALRPAAPERPAAYGLAMVAHDAARMFTPAQAGRIRICASETCSGRFFDRSPAGRRRWCSMAWCGNRNKARRHAAARPRLRAFAGRHGRAAAGRRGRARLLLCRRRALAALRGALGRAGPRSAALPAGLLLALAHCGKAYPEPPFRPPVAAARSCAVAHTTPFRTSGASASGS
jgi:hypothetical protein